MVVDRIKGRRTHDWLMYGSTEVVIAAGRWYWRRRTGNGSGEVVRAVGRW